MSSSGGMSDSLDSFRWNPNTDGTSTGSSAEMATEVALKVCAKCRESLPFKAFYCSVHSKDGRRSQCKKCWSHYNGKKRRHEDIKVSEDANVQPGCLDSLYIMENPRIPGEVKVGRSQNPEERAKQLSAGNNFRLVVRRSYGEKGFLEKTLHQKLKRRRVEEGAGIEWFKVSVDQADILIRAAILEDELSKFLA